VALFTRCRRALVRKTRVAISACPARNCPEESNKMTYRLQSGCQQESPVVIVQSCPRTLCDADVRSAPNKHLVLIYEQSPPLHARIFRKVRCLPQLIPLFSSMP